MSSRDGCRDTNQQRPCNDDFGHKWSPVTVMVEGYGNHTSTAVEHCDRCNHYRKVNPTFIDEVGE